METEGLIFVIFFEKFIELEHVINYNDNPLIRFLLGRLSESTLSLSFQPPFNPMECTIHVTFLSNVLCYSKWKLNLLYNVFTRYFTHKSISTHFFLHTKHF